MDFALEGRDFWSLCQDCSNPASLMNLSGEKSREKLLSTRNGTVVVLEEIEPLPLLCEIASMHKKERSSSQ